MHYYMPTTVVMGDHCIFEHRSRLKELGNKVLIVTGRNSAHANGSYADLVQALNANGQTHCCYDQVMSNPTVDCVFAAAELAREEHCDGVIAIGGGSPIDAAKVAAALAVQPVERSALFSSVFSRALPMAAVPTTAGTGAEVTPNGVITNDAAQTKTSVASPALFPRLAFLDARYMQGLPRRITINTAIDALSHAIEGMLSVRSSPVSDALARASIRAIADCFTALEEETPGHPIREKLLWASNLAGMVIANTGTIAIHAMGYMLTYFRRIDHGRANGLLLGRYLQRVHAQDTRRIQDILAALGIPDLETFTETLDRLLGIEETGEAFDAAELASYADRASQAKNITNSVIPPSRDALLAVFRESLFSPSRNSMPKPPQSLSP
ncbi:MAG: iron-containing alcohol dehydrogenase [Treponema sp.]|jgi:alcohol dehydrogenase class IV|nr:iron-containing alcohol dehydrogenase [Treponema sp.]